MLPDFCETVESSQLQPEDTKKAGALANTRCAILRLFLQLIVVTANLEKRIVSCATSSVCPTSPSASLKMLSDGPCFNLLAARTLHNFQPTFPCQLPRSESLSLHIASLHPGRPHVRLNAVSHIKKDKQVGMHPSVIFKMVCNRAALLFFAAGSL